VARIRKVVRVVLILVPVVLVPLALVMSHDARCDAAPAVPADAATMKGIVHRCYGTPDVLKVEDIEKPVPADDQVLVKVHTAAVNPLDWHYVHGMPYIMRFDSGLGAPSNPRLGVDFAGTVEAVGKNVKRFRPGDEVFGGRTGAFGEYVTIREDRAVVPKPANVTFEQAASVPIAAITALQALRDKGHIQAGQKVLINGASGGVGTFAVQIAKSFGAEVTGVCSTRNLDLVRSLGADHVIDYTKEDFTRSEPHYDLIVDMVSTHGLLEYRRVLTPDGIYVGVGGAGGAEEGKWIGALTLPIKAMLLKPFVHQPMRFMLAELNQQDLNLLSDLMQAGKLKPVIDRSYKLSEVPEAVRYLEQGHARGKVVIAVMDDKKS
jgi:NADPH:quinone reductase-like Zn-dependent oxidoreductase